MTHSEKIAYSKSDLAAQQNILMSEHNIIIGIKRVAPKNYQLIQNYEIKKHYRSRRAARMYIKRLCNLKNNAL